MAGRQRSPIPASASRSANCRPSLGSFQADVQNWLVPKREPNQQAARGAEKITGSEPVGGEDLVSSETLKRKFLEAKKQARFSLFWSPSRPEPTRIITGRSDIGAASEAIATCFSQSRQSRLSPNLSVVFLS